MKRTTILLIASLTAFVALPARADDAATPSPVTPLLSSTTPEVVAPPPPSPYGPQAVMPVADTPAAPAPASEPAPVAAPAAASYATPPPASSSPYPGAAPITWVDEAQFERQLRLVHGKVPDPAIGLFGPQSMMWRVSKYIAPGALGSGRALILQISHPWVTIGIDEHSTTREDPLKRGRETFKYILTMVYGTRDQAMQAARDVHDIHKKIEGRMAYDAGRFPAGSEYRANEVQAMIWVHATLWDTLMMTYEQSIGPVSDYDKERYYQETKLFAYLFGIPDSALPKNWVDFEKYCEDMRTNGTLVATPASIELNNYLFGWHGFILYFPLKYAKLAAAANLPEDLRQQYGLKYGPIRETFFRTTLGMSRFGHKFTPGFITKSPAHKEAVARINHKKAGWFTRLELKVALGTSHLTNDL